MSRRRQAKSQDSLLDVLFEPRLAIFVLLRCLGYGCDVCPLGVFLSGLQSEESRGMSKESDTSVTGLPRGLEWEDVDARE